MEDDFLAWLSDRLPADPRLVVPVGDDAAVFSPLTTPPTVLCIDTIIDGVDFCSSDIDLALIGRKALAINLSDLAAMASTPVAALVSLTATPSIGLTGCKQIYEGLLQLARQHDVVIAGGDFTVCDGPLSLTVTLTGHASPRGSWLRSGARRGDLILVTGQLGGSILGHHLTFSPRLEEARQLQENWTVHAATDISDGLLRDLSHIANSSDLAARLTLETVPITPAAEQLSRDSGIPPLEHALSDGEDFELLLAVPPDEAVLLLEDQPLECGLTWIGHFNEGRGLSAIDSDGSLKILEPTGYQHEISDHNSIPPPQAP
jgi:thiamine-monophosphate kinase